MAATDLEISLALSGGSAVNGIGEAIEIGWWGLLVFEPWGWTEHWAVGVPLLAKEGRPCHQEKESIPIWHGRGGRSQLTLQHSS
jgi:hypothetical protein